MNPKLKGLWVDAITHRWEAEQNKVKLTLRFFITRPQSHRKMECSWRFVSEPPQQIKDT